MCAEMMVLFKYFLTVIHLLLTVVEISADSGRIVVGSQRVLKTLDQSAEMLQHLKYLIALV